MVKKIQLLFFYGALAFTILFGLLSILLPQPGAGENAFNIMSIGSPSFWTVLCALMASISSALTAVLGGFNLVCSVRNADDGYGYVPYDEVKISKCHMVLMAIVTGVSFILTILLVKAFLTFIIIVFLAGVVIWQLLKNR